MPYDSINDIPNHVKKYSKKIQSQWRHVFNSVFSRTKSEERSVKAANSVLKKRFLKGQYASKESHNDYFTMLIDSYLGNLSGWYH